MGNYNVSSSSSTDRHRCADYTKEADKLASVDTAKRCNKILRRIYWRENLIYYTMEVLPMLAIVAMITAVIWRFL